MNNKELKNKGYTYTHTQGEDIENDSSLLFGLLR